MQQNVASMTQSMVQEIASVADMGTHGVAPAAQVQVSTVPQEQVKKELEIDEDLLIWLVDMTKEHPDYHGWADRVTMNDRVVNNTELVTAVLASESFFRNLISMQK